MNLFAMLRPRSVRAQLMFWNIGALALILGALGFLIQYTLRTNLMSSIDRELATRVAPFSGMGVWMRGARRTQANAATASGNTSQGGSGTARGNTNTFVRGPSWRDPNLMRPRLLNVEGHGYFSFSRDEAWDRAAFERSLQGEENYKTFLYNDTLLRLISIPIRDVSKVVGVAQAVHPLEETNLVIAEMNQTLLTLIPVGLLLAGIGGALLTQRALRPIQDIAQTAERIGAQDLSQRLPTVGADEFTSIAVTINAMLERLELAFAQKEELVQRLERLVVAARRFTSDASHELRTPLAIIKANTSLSLRGPSSAQEYREGMEDIDRAADTMNRLVQDLLLLARADEAQLGRYTEVLLVREVLMQAIANLSNRKTARMELKIADSSLTLLGNPDEIVRLFINLLDNAARYTPLDGQITLTASAENGFVRVDVTDTGIGIAPEHLPHLGQRFYRVDPSRSRPDGGAGLGLSICNNIAAAHGGRIAIKSEVGKGTTARVMLPQALDSSDLEDIPEDRPALTPSIPTPLQVG